MVFFFGVSLFADRLTVQTMGCKSISSFQELSDEVKSDILELQKYANEHGCIILSPSDAVEVTTSDPDASATLFLQVLLKRTGESYFVPRSAVMLERPGEKNRLTF